MRALPLALVLALAALAGCFGDDPLPPERTVTASGGETSDGWAYDGAGVGGSAATLEGTLHNVDNTGRVTATFEHAGSAYVATFDQFAEARPFMDGGVAFELVEHGDTGVADASIPRIHATVAAWGTATLTRDGVPVTGAAGERWSAHLMVSRDTVRGADNKITKADGTTPYDPNAPADARRVENDPQAILWLKHPDGETFQRAPVSGTQTLTFNGPSAVQTAAVPAEAGAASVVVNVTAAAAGPAPVGLGQIAVSIKDEAGTELAGSPQAAFLPNNPYAQSFTIPADQVTGPLTVEVTGQGAFSARVDHAIAYADHPFLVLTWDEVTVA